jgi:polar amino acid transport system substrate-binding protein
MEVRFRGWPGVLLLLLLAAVAGAATAGPVAPVKLRIVSDRTAPSSMMVNGVITGRETDKIRELMARTATAYTLELLPWKRAYVMALTGDHTCVYSTTRTPEREALFKWVGATDYAEWQLWGRADAGLSLQTLEDARRLRIGTANGDARDEFLRRRGFNVESVSDDMLNLRKLLLRRIDVWAVSVRSGTKGPRGLGSAGQLAPLLSFHQTQVYLACNASVPDALIARLNAAIAEMWRDGTMARLGRKYENWVAPGP